MTKIDELRKTISGWAQEMEALAGQLPSGMHTVINGAWRSDVIGAQRAGMLVHTFTLGSTRYNAVQAIIDGKEKGFNYVCERDMYYRSLVWSDYDVISFSRVLHELEEGLRRLVDELRV